MLKLFSPCEIAETRARGELARRLTAPGYRLGGHRARCWIAAYAVRLRPFGWPGTRRAAADEALEGPGDVVTERYARRGRDMLVRGASAHPVTGHRGSRLSHRYGPIC